jgi:hypothetical protein
MRLRLVLPFSALLLSPLVFSGQFFSGRVLTQDCMDTAMAKADTAERKPGDYPLTKDSLSQPGVPKGRLEGPFQPGSGPPPSAAYFLELRYFIEGEPTPIALDPLFSIPTEPSRDACKARGLSQHGRRLASSLRHSVRAAQAVPIASLPHFGALRPVARRPLQRIRCLTGARAAVLARITGLSASACPSLRNAG